MLRSLGPVVALVALGCAGDPAPSPAPAPHYESLLALDDWRAVPRDADPFVADRDAAPACATTGFRIEADQAWLELDTSACAWISVTARARFDVELGQGLRIDISHFDLDAPAPTQAELKLRFGECDAWSETIPIPSAADVRRDELASPCILRKNQPVWFHLHNHGQNTYQLQDVAVLR